MLVKHKLLHLSALLVPLIIACADGAQARPEVFRDESLPAAQEEARKTGKLVVADFTAKWCGPCQSMDKNSWTNALVQQWINENAIAVQVDVDAEREIADEVNVHAMPTVVIFGPRDPTTELTRHTGHQSPGQLFTWLSGVKSQEMFFGGLAELAKSLSGQSRIPYWVIPGGACLIAIITLLLLLKPASRRFNRARQQKMEETWVKTPTKSAPESKLIDGKWVGTYKYAEGEEADSAFAATLSGDSTFSGHMIDALGEATIVGAVDYPKVRFKKSYAKSAPGTKVASVFGVYFYDGRFSNDGQVSGEWFVSPGRKNTLRGTFSMKRSQS